MSPEQARGDPVDHRSDIFALGAVLSEILTGRAPFARETTAETLAAVLKEDPPDLPAGVPPGLDRVVRRCLEKDPAERFQSVRDVGFALETASAASESHPIPAASVPSRRWRWWPIAAALFAAAAGAAIAWVAARGVAQGPAPDYRQITFRRGTVRTALRWGLSTIGRVWEEAPRVFTGLGSPNPHFAARLRPLTLAQTGRWLLSFLCRRACEARHAPRAPLSGGAPGDRGEVEFATGLPTRTIGRREAREDRLEFPPGRPVFEGGR
jgi:hypothetical protein